MKRKLFVIMIAASMVITMATGCGGEKKTEQTVESIEEKEPVTAVTFTGETAFTAVQGEAAAFSDLISKAEVESGYNPETVTIQYGDTEFVIDMDADLPENKSDADVTIAMEEDETTLMNEENLPNVTLTFPNVTSEPKTLTVQMDLTNSKDEPGTGEIEIPIIVVPKEISEVKDLTKNLKISETVDNYDFDIYASNIQSKAGDDSNIKAVSVKDSNVEFQKPGHYTVTYEVTFRKPIKVDVPEKDETNTSDKSDASEDITSVEIPTDVAVVGKDEEDDVEADDIIRENVKAETGDKEETTADKENSSETKSNEKTSSGSSSSSSKNGSSESSASSSGSSSSGGSSSGSSASSGSSGSSGAGSSGAASASHTHSWKEHTAKRWVSNMVTVVDTPAQTVYGAQLYAKNADGTWTSNGAIYWFENGFTRDDLGAIIKDKIKNEGYIGNYVNVSKTVPAVTHTEDQGHYETYVDYYYCSCGATKKP